ncbi:MAG TPA: hypothetical protein VLE91_02425 [Candidatus Saccharimonadales bacterium]|nr:hypothetical protein [Candidatus Saccharimonadales bacterium]
MKDYETPGELFKYEPIVSEPGDNLRATLERFVRLKSKYADDLNEMGKRLIDRVINVQRADLDLSHTHTGILPDIPVYEGYFNFPDRPDRLQVPFIEPTPVIELTRLERFLVRLNNASLNFATTIPIK